MTNAAQNGNGQQEGTMRKFGVELEMNRLHQYDAAAALQRAGLNASAEHYNHTTRAHWKATTDATVDGCEVVSPVLEGEDGIQQLRTAAKACAQAGGSVARNCGVHVHVDARGLSLKQMKNLLIHWLRVEGVVLTMVSRSRQGNAYCARNLRQTGYGYSYDEATRENTAIQTMTAAIKACTTFDGLRQVWGSSRYVNLNLESYWRQGSVEFRLHQGSLDANKLERWVRFLLALVERAANKTATSRWSNCGLKAAERWSWVVKLVGLSREEKRYWDRRRQVLHGVDARGRRVA